MSALLMPKATAMWLVDNTSLTFEQIGKFCNLHPLEIQALADGDIVIRSADPTSGGQLSMDDIHACEKDPTKMLCATEKPRTVVRARKKETRYIPIAKRHDKPNAIAWLVKHHPEMTDAQISRLLGTTRPTIMNIRNRTHKDMEKIQAQSPVKLGLCNDDDLQNELEQANRVKSTAKES
jgi:uncharacterized protein